jgi:hypothetical protein
MNNASCENLDAYGQLVVSLRLFSPRRVRTAHTVVSMLPEVSVCS